MSISEAFITYVECRNCGRKSPPVGAEMTFAADPDQPSTVSLTFICVCGQRWEQEWEEGE